MATGTGDAIETKDGRYNNMRVITSDLPGMGKTRSVQQSAEIVHVSGTTSIQLAQCAFSSCMTLTLMYNNMRIGVFWGKKLKKKRFEPHSL